jgi:nicotinamidase-related amidase
LSTCKTIFIHPKCCAHSGGIAAVEPTLKVIERCRREEIKVAWLNWVITEKDLKVMPPAVQRAFNRDLIAHKGYGWHVGLGVPLPDDQGRCLWKGSWNARTYDPLLAVVDPDDAHFIKNRPSGMWQPEEPMHKYLRESGKKTILFAGVNTDQVY